MSPLHVLIHLILFMNWHYYSTPILLEVAQLIHDGSRGKPWLADSTDICIIAP
jgi:hypothetical protein